MSEELFQVSQAPWVGEWSHTCYRHDCTAKTDGTILWNRYTGRDSICAAHSDWYWKNRIEFGVYRIIAAT